MIAANVSSHWTVKCDGRLRWKEKKVLILSSSHNNNDNMIIIMIMIMIIIILSSSHNPKVRDACCCSTADFIHNILYMLLIIEDTEKKYKWMRLDWIDELTSKHTSAMIRCVNYADLSCCLPLLTEIRKVNWWSMFLLWWYCWCWEGRL